MLGIYLIPGRRWLALCGALAGLLSFSSSAWAADANVVRAAGQTGMKSVTVPPDTAPSEAVLFKSFKGKAAMRYDPNDSVTKFANRIFRVPLGNAEKTAAHLNVTGRSLKLSFRLGGGKNRNEEDAAILMHMMDPRAAVPLR